MILTYTEQKQKEFQEQLEANNSTYKLDEKSAKFYEELRTKEKEKEKQIKTEELRDLSRYNRLKQSQKESKRPTEEDTNIQLIAPTIIKKRKVELPDIQQNDPEKRPEKDTSTSPVSNSLPPTSSLGLDGYSSSEDDSN